LAAARPLIAAHFGGGSLGAAWWLVPFHYPAGNAIAAA
jgi:hypothetical protein